MDAVLSLHPDDNNDVQTGPAHGPGGRKCIADAPLPPHDHEKKKRADTPQAAGQNQDCVTDISLKLHGLVERMQHREKNMEHYAAVIWKHTTVHEQEQKGLLEDRMAAEHLLDQYASERIKTHVSYPFVNETIQVGEELGEGEEDPLEGTSNPYNVQPLCGDPPEEDGGQQQPDGVDQLAPHPAVYSQEGYEQQQPNRVGTASPQPPDVFVERVQSWQRPFNKFRSVVINEEFRFVNLDHVTSFSQAIEAWNPGDSE